MSTAVVIFRSRAVAECRERALVLRAMGIEHAVRRGAGEFVLLVPDHRVTDAVRELDHYAEENHGWPRRRKPLPLPHHGTALTGAFLYLAVLLAVTGADSQWTFGVDWFAAGRLQTELARQGEWWRTITALTLHVDLRHLVGNVVLGAVFGVVAGRLLGHGLGWFSIVVAGALGNAAHAMLPLEPHSAVGASTAVFGALGLTGAYVWRRRSDLQTSWAVRWAPLIVAAVLLGWWGTGDERTNVVAHLTGFLAGIALGVVYGSVPAIVTLGPRSQWAFGAGALAVVGGAWALALTSG